MNWAAQHWVALMLFAVYTAFLVAHARAGLRRSKGMGEFFVGGRSMGGVVIGVSFYATFSSTNSYIGHAGKGYEYGLPWLTKAVVLVVFAYLSWRLVAPRLRRFTAQWESVTVPDFLAVRFASRVVRVAAAGVIGFASLLYLIAIFKGAGNLFQVFLDIPYPAAVGVTFAIVMAYTSVGGFVSVVRTDVLQGTLMVVGALLMFGFVAHAAGGVGAIARLDERPDTAHLLELNAGIPYIVLVGIVLAGSLKLLIDPRQMTRFYGLKDERSLRVGIWVAVFGILVVQFALLPVGLYARFLLEGVTDTDLVVPLLVTDAAVFPRVVGDFLVVAIIAAAMSSLDSVLLVAASVVTRDIRMELAPLSGAGAVAWTRGGIIGFAALAALIALKPPGDIVEITIFSGSLYAVCFAPAVLFGLHWRRGSAAAALAGGAVGITVLLAWLALGWQDRLHEVFPALAASTLVYVALACWTRPVDDVRVSGFFAAAARAKAVAGRP